MQERCNSSASANALELRLSCINPLLLKHGKINRTEEIGLVTPTLALKTLQHGELSYILQIMTLIEEHRLDSQCLIFHMWRAHLLTTR